MKEFWPYKEGCTYDELMAAHLSRLVLTHSTHVDGLIPALKRIAHAHIQTIVPGRIRRVAGSSAGGTGSLSFRVTVPVSGGWRVLAQRGTQLQEVFCNGTHLTKEELQRVLDIAKAQK